MKKGFFVHRAWRCVSIAALLLLSTIGYATPPEELLSYELTHDMLRTADRFSVTVYEDGLALVHYPEYMVKAGDYTVELTPSEVQQLRLLVEHPLVQGFNPSEARAQKQAIDAESQALFEISDDSYSNFEFFEPGARKSIRWANLSIDADRYPAIGAFRRLADIEAQLLQLDQHPTASAVVD
jgi:hypothetical protein